MRLLVRSAEDMPRMARVLHVLARFAARHVAFASMSCRYPRKSQSGGRKQEETRESWRETLKIRPRSRNVTNVASMRGNKLLGSKGARL